MCYIRFVVVKGLAKVPTVQGTGWLWDLNDWGGGCPKGSFDPQPIPVLNLQLALKFLTCYTFETFHG